LVGVGLVGVGLTGTVVLLIEHTITVEIIVAHITELVAVKV
jgi:hypothetical protein